MRWVYNPVHNLHRPLYTSLYPLGHSPVLCTYQPSVNTQWSRKPDPLPGPGELVSDGHGVWIYRGPPWCPPATYHWPRASASHLLSQCRTWEKEKMSIPCWGLPNSSASANLPALPHLPVEGTSRHQFLADSHTPSQLNPLPQKSHGWPSL